MEKPGDVKNGAYILAEQLQEHEPVEAVVQQDQQQQQQQQQQLPSHQETLTVNNNYTGVTPVQDVPSQPIPDWSQELRKLRLLPDESVDKHVKIAALYRNFYSTAELLGKIIIRECGLSVANRTIKPTMLGGIAGGEKYLCQKILFKFALCDGSRKRIYENDEEAMKATAHELKGYSAFVSSCTPDLNCALLCTIDYLGYRLVATSVLPIKAETLVHGSDDGGLTIKQNTDVHDLVQSVTSRLNLCNHEVVALSSKERVVASGPVDLEVHRTANNDLYVLDFARMFPPEDQWSLTKLLRRELVSSFSKPLSSDVFSRFTHGASDSLAQEQAVKEAVQLMHDVKIPQVIQELRYWASSTKQNLCHYEESHAKIYEYPSIIFHRNGVNMRHLGTVLSKIPAEEAFICEMLLIQMYTRVAKVDFRARLRQLVKDYPCDESRWRLEVEHFYWHWCSGNAMDLDFNKRVEAKFGISLQSWSKLAYRQDRRMTTTTLVNLVFRAVGIQLSSVPSTGSEFTIFDIDHFSATLGGAALLEHAEACALVLRAQAVPEDSFMFHSKRLLTKALAKFQVVVSMSGSVSSTELFVYLVKKLSNHEPYYLLRHLDRVFVKKWKPDEETTQTIELATSAVELLFSIPRLFDVVASDAQLLLWHVVILQRKELHMRALEILRRIEHAESRLPVLASGFIILGAAVEGVPQPRFGSEPTYWRGLMRFAKQVAGTKLVEGQPSAFVSREEYQKAQVAHALYEKACKMLNSDNIAEHYVDRVLKILNGKTRVVTKTNKDGSAWRCGGSPNEKTNFMLLEPPSAE